MTLFLSQSIFTPPERVSETFVRRSPSAAQSSAEPSTLIPRSAACCTWSKSSAVWSMVFAGMQA